MKASVITKAVISAALSFCSCAQIAVAEAQSVAQFMPLRLTADQVVVTAAQRKDAGKNVVPALTEPVGSFDYFAWPDTRLGALKARGGGYVFFASDGGRHAKSAKYYGCVTRTIGTLDNPLGTGTGSEAPVEAFIQSDASVNPNYAKYSYMGGGSVTRVPQGLPGAGNLLLVYHAERTTTGAVGFYSVLGLAKSLDDGLTWTDMGEIIEANQPYKSNLDGYDIGEPRLVIDPKHEFFLLHFQDWIANGTSHTANSITSMSVARVKIVDLLKAVFDKSGTLPQFAKYYNGKWDQPGINGLSSNVLGSGSAYSGEAQVAYDSVLHGYIAILDDTQNLSYAESADGVTWSNSAFLKSASSISYAAPVADCQLPDYLGRKFYVYYTADANGWQQATVHRVTLELP